MQQVEQLATAVIPTVNKKSYLRTFMSPRADPPSGTPTSHAGQTSALLKVAVPFQNLGSSDESSRQVSPLKYEATSSVVKVEGVESLKLSLVSKREKARQQNISLKRAPSHNRKISEFFK